ncbi:hypothetical protein MIND_00233400 [Mycena indigotica]|uniref:Uncharacterized protein n=1 Tax=Mycena indigotica TaxID=2126181 RepID=A0A8H6TAA0_9AGAR|nr:uncharacterized protein MIND_00233400 [Mycena indigotica]KAF7312205.1 hypothetical protein MIND_00233400 [Mycena indigotica]
MGDQSLPLERSWYIGNTFFAILYGLQLSMYLQSMYHLNVDTANLKAKRSSKVFYMAYSSLLLVLITIAFAANLWFGEAMWIEHRDIEGGPVEFFGENIAAWYNTFGTAADVTANVLGDGLMLYRCFIFWGHMKLAMVFPTLIYLASVAMGITTTIQSGLPNGNFFQGVTVNFGIPWLVLTIVFNILVTAMIVARLLWVQNKMSSVLGTDVSKRYTGLLAVLVESALPFTVLGIVYLALYIRNLPEALSLADIWGAVVALSPQAIILRLAVGAGWTKDAFDRVSTGMELSVVNHGGEEQEESQRSKASHPSSHV